MIAIITFLCTGARVTGVMTKHPTNTAEQQGEPSSRNMRFALTTIFISNMQCPSCVQRVERALDALYPKPSSVSISIISQSVAIRHNDALNSKAIVEALEAEGFEIHSVSKHDQPDIENVCAGSGDQSSSEWADDVERAITRFWRRSFKNRPLAIGAADEQERETPILVGKPKKGKESIRGRDKCTECRNETAQRILDGDSLLLTKYPYLRDANPTSPDSTEAGKMLSHDPTPDEFYESKEDFVKVEAVPEAKLYRAELSITGMTCSACVASVTELLEALSFVRSVNVSLLTNSATVVFDGEKRTDEIIRTIEDAAFDATLEILEEYNPGRKAKSPVADVWKAEYAIGGMTCSACVSNITQMVEKLPFIDNVDVNLLTNSASIILHGKTNVDSVTQTIEDAGFDATLDSLEQYGTAEDEQYERDVSIRINGMYCHHCPTMVLSAIFNAYGNTVEVKKAPTLAKPVMRLRYMPKPPQLTIRHILLTLHSADRAFKPSIYHPPTIEDRSRALHAKERKQIVIRLVLCMIAAIPAFIIGIVFMTILPSNSSMHRFIMENSGTGNVSRAEWALFIIATPVYFFAADKFHTRAIKEVIALWRPGSKTPILQRFTRFGSMNMLLSLGTSIAYFSSFAQFMIALIEPSTSGTDMNDSEPSNTVNGSTYFDSVVFLTMFILMGRFIEAYSKAKTGDAVTALGNLRPREAILVEEPETAGHKLSVDLLEIGDVVLVPHGSSPPYDGIIVDGVSEFDESSLTGESSLVKKSVNSQVFSGTVNKGGPVHVRLTSVSGTSMLDQIIKIVREGQTKRAPVERVADVITSHFVPFVILVAITTWVTWLILGLSKALPESWRGNQGGGWPVWSLRFAIAVFVIACPCGIGLAAPTALFVGGGLAAKNGILVKGGGEAFQEASTLDCIVFDKTGTLTQGGEPAVTDWENLTDADEEEILGMAKALEMQSSHPVAKAIANYCSTRTQYSFGSLEVEELPGRGMSGRITLTDGTEKITIVDIIAGNEALMRENEALPDSRFMDVVDDWKRQGKSIVLVARRISNPSEDVKYPSWIPSAMFAIADALRPESHGTVTALQRRGIDVWMLSGDNQTTAGAVAQMVGIEQDHVIADVLPSEKAEKILWLQKTLPKPKNRHRAMVAMVGDGINDSPALTMADVGIAVGSGSDIAISSADFILISSDLRTVLTLIDLSRKVFQRVWFNFGWALVYNLIAMPVAAGLFYPIVSRGKHVSLDPIWASLAMALSSVSVVCSSLALRSKIPVLGFRPKKNDF